MVKEFKQQPDGKWELEEKGERKMKIPYIIEEFKNNEWTQVSNPTNKVYAKAQYETLVKMSREVRCIYDGKIIWPEML